VDEETGLCVVPDDPAATADAIRTLLEDEVLRARMETPRDCASVSRPGPNAWRNTMRSCAS
jgi:glycosyltransferase involved in cell wall biosynthesis